MTERSYCNHSQIISMILVVNIFGFRKLTFLQNSYGEF